MVYIKEGWTGTLHSLIMLVWMILVFCLRMTQGILVSANVLFICIPKHFIVAFYFVVGLVVAAYSQVKFNTHFVMSYLGLVAPHKTLTFPARGTTKSVKGMRATLRAVEWCYAVHSSMTAKYFGWDMSIGDNICGVLCFVFKWLSCVFWRSHLLGSTVPDAGYVLPSMSLSMTARKHNFRDEPHLITSVFVDKNFPGGAAIVVVAHENEGYLNLLTNLNRQRNYTPRKFKGEDEQLLRLVDVDLFNSAQKICGDLGCHLEECDEKWNRIVVTGYSLGGGLAVYLTGLLQNRFPKKMVFGYAFGPPCVLTKRDIATTPIENLRCYMFSQDIVPRLSQYWVWYALVLCYEYGRRLFGCASMKYKWNDWEEMAVPNPITLFARSAAVALPSPPFNPFREGFLECAAQHSIHNYVGAIRDMAELAA